MGTVSRVLNGSPAVREVTRRHVQEVIDRLNYRPSRLAVGLSKGSPGQVAILVPYLTRPSAVQRLAGAIEVLDQGGHTTVVCSVESAAQRDHHLDALTDRHHALGVIVVSIPLSPSRVDEFRKAGVPLVLVDVDVPGVPQIVSDDCEGGRIATEHLISLGHRRIGFIGDEDEPELRFRSTRRRLRGYRKALERAGVEPSPRLVRLGRHSATAARLLAEEMLEDADSPTAIFAASDTQATGVLAAAQSRGLSVPDEVAVIGFDGLEVSGLLGISTVSQPLRESGSIGARVLCELMEAGPLRPRRTLLDLHLEARRSTLGAGVLHGDPVTDAFSTRAPPAGNSRPATRGAFLDERTPGRLGQVRHIEELVADGAGASQRSLERASRAASQRQ